MAAFSLTKDGSTFDFDLQGNVSQAGNAIGTWNIDNNNQISITKTDGSSVQIPADWGFNTGNQLELRQGSKVIFNFLNDARVRPEIQVDHGVLLIAPDQNNADFFFPIHGTWGIDNNFNLLFTVGAVTSTINGILNDTQTSEFAYIFITQGPVARQYELDLTGAWEQNGSGVDVDFRYDTEDPQQPGKIQLPPGLTMDPTSNILLYTYNKGDHTGSLQLAGSVRVNPNFSLTYVLDAQDAAGIKSTTFAIAASIDEGSAGEGNLKLKVQRTDKEQILEIGGNYHGVIAGQDLTVGFAFTRTVSGTQITDSVAFTGKVVNPGNGNTFAWQFNLNGKDFSIDITAHVALSSGACINASLNVTVNGQQMGITAMFGISTNCSSAKSVLPNVRRKLSLSGGA